MTLTQDQLVYGTLASLTIIVFVYHHCGFTNIRDCYKLWFTRAYWTNYNIVDAVSWLAKAAIIIPGLIFGIQVWQLYWFALLTSATLIWASYKRVSPTVVGFNTIWCWISCVVLAQHLVPWFSEPRPEKSAKRDTVNKIFTA